MFSLFSRSVKKPAISIVLIVYRMAPQAMNTLESLSERYQQHISNEDYEVIIVENPSDNMLDEARVNKLGKQYRYYLMEKNSPSPVEAVNFGISQAKAPVTGLMVDGARLLSPGVLYTTLAVYRLDANAIVSVPGYHLGKEVQQQAVDTGYDESVEAGLLASIDWPADGYDLFGISCLSGSCAGGIFLPVAESNCLFAPTSLLNELGGCDPGFKTPGGGFVNLDLYRRLCEYPDSVLYLLPGEGTFHQYHGGVTTSKEYGDRDRLMKKMHEEYRQLRGVSYSVLDIQPVFFGKIPSQVMPFVEYSAQRYIAHRN